MGLEGVHHDGLGGRKGQPCGQLPPSLSYLFLEHSESLLSKSGQAAHAWQILGLGGATPAVKGGWQQLVIHVFLYVNHVCIRGRWGEWQGMRGWQLTRCEEGQVQHFCELIYLN